MGNLLFKFTRGAPKQGIVFLGLSNTGKTMALQRLAGKDFNMIMPTMGFNAETVMYKSRYLTVWEVGGSEKFRPMYKHYYHNAQCIFYFVDCVDRDRLEESRQVLAEIVSDIVSRHLPIVILANKQDITGAITPDEVKEYFSHSVDFGSITWSVFGVSVTYGKRLSSSGLPDALDWFVNSLSMSQENNKSVVKQWKHSAEIKDNGKRSSGGSVTDSVKNVFLCTTCRPSG